LRREEGNRVNFVLQLLLALSVALTAQDVLIETIAGNGDFSAPTQGSLAAASPVGVGFGVAFDREDRLYVAAGSGVWRVSAEGRWEKFWALADGGLLMSLAFDSEGRLYAGEALSRRVYRVDADGNGVVVAGENGSLGLPGGLAVDRAGNLFTQSRDGIQVVNAQGRVSTFAGPEDAWLPNGGMGLDGEGNLYVAGYGSYSNAQRGFGSIRRIAPDGSVTMLAGGNPDDDRVQGALAVTVCANGEVYFIDSYRLQKLTPDGPEVVAGSRDRVFAVDAGPASDARFLTPVALACDSQGRIAVYDAGAARIRRISRWNSEVR
jgi:hypothetical protein